MIKISNGLHIHILLMKVSSEHMHSQSLGSYYFILFHVRPLRTNSIRPLSYLFQSHLTLILLPSTLKRDVEKLSSILVSLKTR